MSDRRESSTKANTLHKFISITILLGLVLSLTFISYASPESKIKCEGNLRTILPSDAKTNLDLAIAYTSQEDKLFIISGLC